MVLNADYRPLSYYPLSLWPWQETIKAVFLGRVDVVSTYDKLIHSPSFEMPLPSVVSLKQYVAQDRPPAFTRFNVFLRDVFTCQYCGSGDELTFDHVTPRSRGGRTTWENIVTACAPLQSGQGQFDTASGADVSKAAPVRADSAPAPPQWPAIPPNYLHDSWLDDSDRTPSSIRKLGRASFSGMTRDLT